MTMLAVRDEREVARVTRWIWLGPSAFLVHDTEELVTMVPWIAAHRALLPAAVRPLAESVTTTGLALGVAALFTGFVFAAAHGVRRARRGAPSWPFLVAAGAFVGNGVTHLAQAAYVGGYTPGVVTALLVSLPYGWGLARACHAAGLASTRALALCLAIGVVAQVPIALAALTLTRGA